MAKFKAVNKRLRRSQVEEYEDDDSTDDSSSELPDVADTLVDPEKRRQE